MDKINQQETSQTTDILYAVPLSPLSESKGETPIYRHPDAVNGLTKIIKRLPHITTLQALHDHSFKEYADLDCLGTRLKNPDGSLGEYHFKPYSAISLLAKKAGSAVVKLNLAPPVSAPGYPDCRFMIVYANNSEKWMSLDIGACLYGFAVVPIFTSLGVESLQYVIEQTGALTIFCSAAHLDRIIKEGSEKKLHNIKTIVCFDGYKGSQKEAAEAGGLKLLSWEELIEIEDKDILPYPEVTPDTVFTLQYTSGTTGNPKGAILTHRNFIAHYAGAEEKKGNDLEIIGKGDVHISYLPLSHIFERAHSHRILSRGGKIGYSSGNVQKLNDDLQTLKPTFMLGVPKIYNRFRDTLVAMLGKISPKTDPIKDPLDAEIVKQLRNVTGGRVKVYYSGSAPIDPEVTRFLTKAFGAPLIEGFGQSEVGAAFSQVPEDQTTGHVGGIFSSLEFKLVDVPDMNYTSQDKGPNGEPMPRGELHLRGDQVFRGYYKEPEKTAEAIDKDGWSHTGDIATILANGALQLIDRKQNIFKLSQGEYIAPEKIENVYLNNKYVAEVFIYGDPFKSYTVGIVVPDAERLMELAKVLGLEGKKYDELCKDDKIYEYLLEDTKRTARAAKLNGYEIAQALYLESKPLSAQGMLTATMKLKRNIAKAQYKEVIGELYKKPVVISSKAE